MGEIQNCLQILVAGEAASRAVIPSIHHGTTAFLVLHINFYILIKYYFSSFIVTYINKDFSQ